MRNRRFNRIRFESHATVLIGGQTFDALTENLSLNGLFVRSDKHLPVGNKAEILFSLPSASRNSAIKVNGVVVRNDVHGMAFQFGSLDEDCFSRLQTVINRKSPNRLKLHYE